jgi:hypothetical protein
MKPPTISGATSLTTSTSTGWSSTSCIARRTRGVVERFSLVVEPSRMDHALVVGGRRHPGGSLGLPHSSRIGRSDIIDRARQDRRRHLRRERQDVIEFDAVDIRQAFVPVVRVPLHHPDLVLDPPDRAERAGAGIDDELAQIVVVLLQGPLAHDDIPAAGDCRHHEVDRAGLRQFEFDGVFVACTNLAY